MLCQGVLTLVGAHVNCPFICFPAFKDYTNYFVTRNQLEVCPLSRRMTSVALHPYPRHYSKAFAFSNLLYPLIRQPSLRSACPLGRRSGLPCSDVSTEWPGSFFTPGISVVCVLSRQRRYTESHSFFPQPVSIFGWTVAHDACKGSHPLTIFHSSQPQFSA